MGGPGDDDAAEEASQGRSGSGGGARLSDRGAKRLTTRRFKDEILTLEQEVQQARRQVDKLWRQRHVLHAHSDAAQVAVEQCMALLRLGTLLHQQQPQGAPAGQQQQPAQQQQQQQPYHQQHEAERASAACTAAAAQNWRAHMAQMEEQLFSDSSTWAGAGASPEPGTPPPPTAPACAAPPPEPAGAGGGGGRLGWSPERAVQWFGGGGVDLSTEGLRRAIQRFVQRAGPLYFKTVPGSGSPDAERAVRELAVERERLMAFSAMLVVTGNGHAPSEVLLTSLDPHDGACACGGGADCGGGACGGGGSSGACGGGGGCGDGGGGGGRPPPMDAEWMLWVASRLELDEQQEELLLAALQGLEERTAPGRQERSHLLAECAARRDDGDLLQAAVARVSAGLFAYQLMVCVYMLAVYSTILRPDQLAALFLAAWPFVPSLSGLRLSLRQLRVRRRGGGGGEAGAGGGAAGAAGAAGAEAPGRASPATV